jgi:hypothetical protein
MANYEFPISITDIKNVMPLCQASQKILCDGTEVALLNDTEEGPVSLAVAKL